jgi:hypothetical protein
MTATVVTQHPVTRKNREKLDEDGVETCRAISSAAPTSERVGAPVRR